MSGSHSPDFASARRNRQPLETRLITATDCPNIGELTAIWRHLDAMPYLFDDTTRSPFAIEHLLAAPNTVAFQWGRPARGLLWAHSIIEGFFGLACIATWSPSAWGRAGELRNILLAVMRARNLQRVTAIIAEPNQAARALAGRVGFREEGRMRKALPYNGVWLDVILCGILRSDLEPEG